MQIRQVGARGAARIDRHHAHRRTLLLRLRQSLIGNRMGPGGVGAHQHHQIRLGEIFITAGYRVRAKGALVAHHRRGHAEARVGVDIGRAEIALHQLVGDVVILGEQLAGGVDRHRLRTVLLDNGAQARGCALQRAFQRYRLAVDPRPQQPTAGVQGIAQRGAFDAQASEVGRMADVAGDGAVDAYADAAADAAVGTGALHEASAIRLSGRFATQMRPASSFTGQQRS